jgi:alpha-ketoglutarate-dependent taurine dioxygenase
MTPAFFKEHRTTLFNDEWRTFRDLPGEFKNAIRDIPMEYLQELNPDGSWVASPPGPLRQASIYRMHPEWIGPQEYVLPPTREEKLEQLCLCYEELFRSVGVQEDNLKRMRESVGL